MKRYNKADIVLCAVFFIFVLFFVMHKHFPGSYVGELLFASAEAALIGGIADWFAVSALFKKPLGFGWHTALIPRHRDKLIVGIRELVQGNLLSSESIRIELSGIRLVDYVIGFIEKDERLVISKLLGYGQNLLTQLGVKENLDSLAESIKNQAAEANLLPVYQQLFVWLYQNKKVDKGLDKLIDKLIILVEKPVFLDYLTSLVEEYSQPKVLKEPQSVWDIFKGAAAKLLLGVAEAADIFNPAEMAKVLQEELISMLAESRQPEAMLRQVMIEGLMDIHRQLKENERLQESVRRWQNGIVRQMDLQAILQVIFNSLQSVVINTTDAHKSMLTEWLTGRLQKYWHIFKYSKAMQDWLEEYLQRGVGRLVTAQNDFIGQIVIEALTSLSDPELNEFVEDKAGKDLAWIRINGSVVGGVVGAGLFLFVREVYNPFIMPLLREFLQRML